MKHWKRRWLKPIAELSPRQAAIRGNWTKQIRRLYAYRDMYNRQLVNTDDPYEVDHCLPLSLGGMHIYENLWIVRKSMNARGTQLRTHAQIEYALTQGNIDRFKAHEAWPNC